MLLSLTCILTFFYSIAVVKWLLSSWLSILVLLCFKYKLLLMGKLFSMDILLSLPLLRPVISAAKLRSTIMGMLNLLNDFVTFTESSEISPDV